MFQFNMPQMPKGGSRMRTMPIRQPSQPPMRYAPIREPIRMMPPGTGGIKPSRDRMRTLPMPGPRPSPRSMPIPGRMPGPMPGPFPMPSPMPSRFRVPQGVQDRVRIPGMPSGPFTFTPGEGGMSPGQLPTGLPAPQFPSPDRVRIPGMPSGPFTLGEGGMSGGQLPIGLPAPQFPSPDRVRIPGMPSGPFTPGEGGMSPGQLPTGLPAPQFPSPGRGYDSSGINPRASGMPEYQNMDQFFRFQPRRPDQGPVRGFMDRIRGQMPQFRQPQASPYGGSFLDRFRSSMPMDRIRRSMPMPQFRQPQASPYGGFMDRMRQSAPIQNFPVAASYNPPQRFTPMMPRQQFGGFGGFNPIPPMMRQPMMPQGGFGGPQGYMF